MPGEFHQILPPVAIVAGLGDIERIDRTVGVRHFEDIMITVTIAADGDLHIPIP